MIFKRFSAAVILCALFAVPGFVHAATLSIAPQSGTYTVGSTFSVDIDVSSKQQAMNAVSAQLLFPSSKLQVVSISKRATIISLWVQEPSYSNNAGQVNLSGIVLNPGFMGTDGQVLSVEFRVIAAGDASLQFTSSSVLANDGQGTNILDGLGEADFTLTAPSETPRSKPSPTPTPTKTPTPSPVKTTPAPATTTQPAPTVASTTMGTTRSIEPPVLTLLVLMLAFLLLWLASRKAHFGKKLFGDNTPEEEVFDSVYQRFRKEVLLHLTLLNKEAAKNKVDVQTILSLQRFKDQMESLDGTEREVEDEMRAARKKHQMS